MDEIREALRKLLELKGNYEKQLKDKIDEYEQLGLGIVSEDSIDAENLEAYDDIIDFAQDKSLLDVVKEILRGGYLYQRECFGRILGNVTDFREASGLGGIQSVTDFLKRKFTEDTRIEPPDRILKFGEAYGRLGIKPQEIPEIALGDRSFIEGYLFYYPEKEERIVGEGKRDYDKYMEYFNILERAQNELDLRKEREEQDTLNGRTKIITEAEALVYQEQGIQPK